MQAAQASEAGLDLRGERGADARDRRDLLDRRLADPLHRAEDPEQRRPPPRPDPGQVVEGGSDRRLAPQLAVVGDREAMGLVADPLDEVEGLRGRRQEDRLRAVRQDELLALLGEAGERQVVEAQLVEDDLRGADLRPGRRR